MRGFEPPLSRPPDVRFTGLSYIPKRGAKVKHFSGMAKYRTLKAFRGLIPLFSGNDKRNGQNELTFHIPAVFFRRNPSGH